MAERYVRQCVRLLRIELVRSRSDVGRSIRPCGVQQHERSRRDDDTMHLDIDGSDTQQRVADGGESQQLVDDPFGLEVVPDGGCRRGSP